MNEWRLRSLRPFGWHNWTLAVGADGTVTVADISVGAARKFAGRPDIMSSQRQDASSATGGAELGRVRGCRGVALEMGPRPSALTVADGSFYTATQGASVTLRPPGGRCTPTLWAPRTAARRGTPSRSAPTRRSARWCALPAREYGLHVAHLFMADLGLRQEYHITLAHDGGGELGIKGMSVFRCVQCRPR